jgi:hypothetical protein
MGMAVPPTAAGMVPVMTALAAAAVGLPTTPAATASLHHGMVDDGAAARRRLPCVDGSHLQENDQQTCRMTCPRASRAADGYRQ